MPGKIELLDDTAKIAGLDRSGMLGTVTKFPQLLLDALTLSQQVKLPKLKKITNIMIAGMGGSAMAGQIALDFLSSKISMPLNICRNYDLPNYINPGTLFIANSYSGNTEETLSAFQQAEKKQAQIVCVTAGGKLAELARRLKAVLFIVPAGYQPRAALPYMLAPILYTLEQLGLAANLAGEIKLAADLLGQLKDEYELSKPTRYNPAKQLATKISGKTPLILACHSTQAAGQRWCSQLNENSKLLASLGVFPELNHNQMVALAALKREGHNYCAILLRDDQDSERLKKRLEVTKSLVGKQLGGIHEVCSRGKSDLSRILSLVYLGDFVSVYVACLRGLDPTPVDVISRLKKELAR